MKDVTPATPAAPSSQVAPFSPPLAWMTAAFWHGKLPESLVAGETHAMDEGPLRFEFEYVPGYSVRQHDRERYPEALYETPVPNTEGQYWPRAEGGAYAQTRIRVGGGGDVAYTHIAVPIASDWASLRRTIAEHLAFYFSGGFGRTPETRALVEAIRDKA